LTWLPSQVWFPLVDLSLVTGPERLAQLELLHLAGGRARQAVGELDPLRALVAGEVLAAVRDDVLAPSRGSRRTTSAVTARPTLVGNADHGDLATRGCETDASSTSIDDTFSPPVMMTSFLRSEIADSPSSEDPPSPVWNQLPAWTPAVSSGLSQ
jgi:hypothetical protein